MKRTGSVVFLLFLTLIIFTSCEEETTVPNDDLLASGIVTLDKATAMDDLLLPAGTKIQTVSEGQIKVELPGKYQFLLYDEEEGVSFSRFGSYSYTCSGQNSCKVFYTSKAGYGCLQNNCSGKCTGESAGVGAKQIAYGIINNESKELLGENFTPAGNLTHKGHELFLEYVAREKLVEFFDIAYASSSFKNAEELIAREGEQSTTRVVLQYKGIAFAAVVPNFDQEKDFQIVNFKSGSTVNCSGSKGCSCKQGKKCFLGNCVYFCDGCTTCTLSVNE
ncbi:hypothetical protein [Croceiramulus getboli]|nr:hypothetical protein P8624_05540 [Flavobacteriaceae bacterium YJPT1-3]